MLRPSLRDLLIATLASAGHVDKMDFFLAEAQECINIHRIEDGSSISIGASRLGGLPDLPVDVPWPRGIGSDDERTLYADFIAQLNFAELPPIDGLSLPKRGRLWIFMAGWSNSQAVLTTVQDSTGEMPVELREAPTQMGWAAYPTLGEEQDRPMTTGTIALRFDVGIALPFGRRSFERELRSIPRVRNTVRDAIVPSELQGTIGDFGYDSVQLRNHRLNVELAQCGKRDWLRPYSFETIAELDRAVAELPERRAKDSAYVAKFTAQLEEMRPRVEWVEQHHNELNEWQPFIWLAGNWGIDLTWGSDTAALWTFIRATDLASSNFGMLVGETIP